MDPTGTKTGRDQVWGYLEPYGDSAEVEAEAVGIRTCGVRSLTYGFGGAQFSS